MSQTGDNLSHLDSDGVARMVDVGAKPITQRSAAAEGFVRVSPSLAIAILSNSIAKGNLLQVARLAGVQAAKRTDELIPLCHSLPLDHVDVDVTLDEAAGLVKIVARVGTHSRTGVEMEALTAVAVAALTIIDMGKAIDKGMVIESIRVTEKQGGRSGTYRT